MHPSPKFSWTDEAAMLAFIDQVSFATIFVDGPFVVHVPLVVVAPGRLRFHVARANRAAGALEGARAIASLLGPDAYISPDWYGVDGQVPTWNYVAVEAEGALTRLSEAELVAQLEQLRATQESRLAPKPEWFGADTDPERFASLLRAIEGYELRVDALRGTRKLGQNKPAEQRAHLAAALTASGRGDMAQLMEQPA